jgi:hypothetical protein
VAPPAPGLPTPARRIQPGRRLLVVAIVAGYVLLALAVILLLTGSPADGWGSPLLFLLVVLAPVALAVYAGVPGEMRAGPGWIAVRRGRRWSVVTAAGIAAVRALPHPSAGYVVRFLATSGQYVDFSPRMLRRPGVAEPVFALLDDAARREVGIDLAVSVLVQTLRQPGQAGGEVASREAEPGLWALYRAGRRYRWLRLVMVVALGLQVGAVVLVAVVRLLGFR